MNDILLTSINICDYASISVEGKFNILGIFREISVKELPYTHPQMYVATNIDFRKIGNYSQIIKIIREEDEQEIIKPLEVKLSVPEFPAEKKVAHVGFIAKIDNLKFEKPGVHVVKIFVDTNLVGETRFNVNKIG